MASRPPLLPPFQPPSLPPLLQQGKVQIRTVPLHHLNPVLLLHLRPHLHPQDPRKQILPLLLRLLQVLQGHLPERLHLLPQRLLRGRLQAAQPQDLLLFRTTATILQSRYLNP